MHLNPPRRPGPLLALLLLFSPASAAGESEQKVGLGSDALPSVLSIGIAEPARAQSIALASSLGYGWTESQTSSDGNHHRGFARVAGALWPTGWLGVTLESDARYDLHPQDGGESDDGWVFDGTLGARAAAAFGALRLGAQLDLWLPGGDDASASLSALSPDLRLLGAALDGPFTVGAQLGYRLDRSSAAVASPERLRFGDRLALGLSDFDAAMLGLGASFRVGTTELLAELSAEVLLGEHAPPLSESLLRASLGARQALSPHLSGELSFSTTPSARADLSAGSPLIPIEPRLSITIGVRYRLGESAGHLARTEENAAPPKPAVQLPAPPAKAVAVDTKLELRLKDDQDKAVNTAEVRLVTSKESFDLVPDGQGGYWLEHAPLGPSRLEIRGVGLQPLDQDVQLEPNTPATFALHASPALPAGQLRGLVRSYAGTAVVGQVRVEPLALTTTSNQDGFFQIDVPPGDYEVVIEAAGFQTQRRPVRVEKDGVLILNADLKKAQP